MRTVESEKKAEFLARVGLLLQAIGGIFLLLLGRWNNSLTTTGVAYHTLAGVLVWLLSLVHIHQRRLVLQEKIAREELEKKRPLEEGRLFESEPEEEAFTASYRLSQIEKWFLPGGILAVSLLNFLLAYRLFQTVSRAEVSLNHAVLSAIFLASWAFIFFLLGKFSGGMSTQKEWRPLRSGAGVILSASLWAFVASAGVILYHLGLTLPEKVIAYILVGVMSLLGIEFLINFTFNIYHPRIPGEERIIYDSRFLGLLVEPANLGRSLAQFIDYQFGFKVSETWFYKFMERVIAPLIIFQIVAFYLLTSIVVVQPGKALIIERFGVPRNQDKALGPGIHLKWPWPFETAHIYPVDKIQNLWLGFEGEAEKYMLWVASHYKKEEYAFLTPSREGSEESEGKGEGGSEARAVPVNMVSMAVQIQYRTKNVFDYAYNCQDPAKLLEDLAYRELVKLTASMDLMEALTRERIEMGKILRENLQKAADRVGLGVEILYAGVAGLHPPVEVGRDFEAVVNAMEEKEASILAAEGYAGELEPLSRAQAEAQKILAEAYKFKRIKLTEAEAERFTKQLKAYEASPRVYKFYSYLRSLKEGLGNIRKYIVPQGTSSGRITILNLEEKLRPELLEVKIGKKKGEEK